MKDHWLESVRHIHAQDAAWFVGFLLIVGAVALWIDYRKEVKDNTAQRGNVRGEKR